MRGANYEYSKQPDVVALQSVLTGEAGQDRAIVCGSEGDASDGVSFELIGCRGLTAQSRSTPRSITVALQLVLYSACSALLRVRWTRAALSHLSPLRETAASTGGVAPLLCALSAILAAPFQGHSVALRSGCAQAGPQACAALGGGATAQLVTLALPSALRAPRARRSLTAPPSPRTQGPMEPQAVMLVNACLGELRPEDAALRLTAWLDAALASSHPPVSAVLLAGPGLAQVAALREWGLRSCAADAGGAAGADLMVREMAAGVRVDTLASSRPVTATDAPHAGLLVTLEVVGEREDAAGGSPP